MFICLRRNTQNCSPRDSEDLAKDRAMWRGTLRNWAESFDEDTRIQTLKLKDTSRQETRTTHIPCLYRGRLCKSSTDKVMRGIVQQNYAQQNLQQLTYACFKIFFFAEKCLYRQKYYCHKKSSVGNILYKRNLDMNKEKETQPYHQNQPETRHQQDREKTLWFIA